MSFRQYIADAPVTEDAAGDFIADAKADATLPEAETWDELRAHLSKRGASDEAIEAAEDVWSIFEASQAYDWDEKREKSWGAYLGAERSDPDA